MCLCVGGGSPLLVYNPSQNVFVTDGHRKKRSPETGEDGKVDWHISGVSPRQSV